MPAAASVPTIVDCHGAYQLNPPFCCQHHHGHGCCLNYHPNHVIAPYCSHYERQPLSVMSGSVADQIVSNAAPINMLGDDVSSVSNVSLIPHSTSLSMLTANATASNSSPPHGNLPHVQENTDEVVKKQTIFCNDALSKSEAPLRAPPTGGFTLHLSRMPVSIEFLTLSSNAEKPSTTAPPLGPFQRLYHGNDMIDKDNIKAVCLSVGAPHLEGSQSILPANTSDQVISYDGGSRFSVASSDSVGTETFSSNVYPCTRARDVYFANSSSRNAPESVSIPNLNVNETRSFDVQARTTHSNVDLRNDESNTTGLFGDYPDQYIANLLYNMPELRHDPEIDLLIRDIRLVRGGV